MENNFIQFVKAEISDAQAIANFQVDMALETEDYQHVQFIRETGNVRILEMRNISKS